MQSLLHQESASLLKHAFHERDSAITERDLIEQSHIWKSTNFLRKAIHRVKSFK